MLEIDQNLVQHNKADVRNTMGTKTNNGEISNTFAEAGTFLSHFQVQSEEESNKCNQCEYASSQAGDLRRHLRTHNGEKSNKCNLCDYASSQAGDLRKHLKMHIGEKSNK